MKYRKKPEEIEAKQVLGTPESNREIINWTRGSHTPVTLDKNSEDQKQLTIPTLTGAVWINIGDYIVKVFDDDIFYVVR